MTLISKYFVHGYKGCFGGVFRTFANFFFALTHKYLTKLLVTEEGGVGSEVDPDHVDKVEPELPGVAVV